MAKTIKLRRGDCAWVIRADGTPEAAFNTDSNLMPHSLVIAMSAMLRAEMDDKWADELSRWYEAQAAAASSPLKMLS